MRILRKGLLPIAVAIAMLAVIGVFGGNVSRDSPDPGGNVLPLAAMDVVAPEGALLQTADESSLGATSVFDNLVSDAAAISYVTANSEVTTAASSRGINTTFGTSFEIAYEVDNLTATDAVLATETGASTVETVQPTSSASSMASLLATTTGILDGRPLWTGWAVHISLVSLALVTIGLAALAILRADESVKPPDRHRSKDRKATHLQVCSTMLVLAPSSSPLLA